MSTRVCFAVTAFRIRVSMSAIGSVISLFAFGYRPLSAVSVQRSALPAALGDAGDVALERQLAEAQAAQRELPHVGPRTSAQVAAVAQPHLVLRFLLFLRDLCGSGHISLSPSAL